ncbi:uncharacterized protein LOC119571267 [Penaeus monodon]|uniref:uncharacterized protein LOC119571267 n=1 Tax=Penaeus monodon TaxID=6687 RepID=UPI0018A7A2F5|nr:uncharacterized protein LOC119571267 [Penaeus monodon]
MYNFITQNNLMLITPPGLITRIDPKTGKGSTIDYFIGSPELRSDHLPIILNDDNQITETHTKESTWKFNNEGWKNFQVELTNKDIKGIKSITELIDIIKNTAKKHFRFDNKISKNNPSKPWWNEKCREAIKKRNKAFNKWRKNPNEINRIEYKKLQIKAKKLSKRKKRIVGKLSVHH